MRHRSLTVVLAIAAVVLFVLVRGVIIGQDSSDRDESGRSSAKLATRTVASGDVTVKITPQQISRTGAVFKVIFDTHSEELTLDVTRNARLTVGGTAWAEPTWDGDGPGGHQRSGTLRFASSGPPTGTALLRLSGLPSPVSASWTLPRV